MSLPKQYDIIIAGAGASGLSLLRELAHSEKLSRKKILLADRSLAPSADKTWCFWDQDASGLNEMIFHTWDFLEVTALNQSRSEKLDQYKYHCIRSIDYSKKILNLAHSHPNVELLEAGIESFRPISDKSSEITTSEGVYTAPIIFQSVMKPEVQQTTHTPISVYQHFLGWEFQTKKDLFDPNKALFMDFDVPQKNGVAFMYLLPFSKQTALAEFTIFSSEMLADEEYENEIRTYLDLNYSLCEGDYTISRKEKGVIPMEDRLYPAWYCNRVLNLGTMGGLTKPSTGFTFTRILNHSKSIVRALEANSPLPCASQSPFRYRVYDRMLLYLLKHNPDQSLEIFSELFRNNKIDDILQFLNEETSFPGDLKIMWSVPSLPFLKTIFKLKHRLFIDP